MKKFLIKLVAYALIVCTILLCINTWYIKMIPDNEDSTDKFLTIPSNIEVCNFGSSHGLNDYNYANYADEYICFNFGLASQTLSYDYRLMDYYQGHLSEGCTVFITLSYFSFIESNETEQDSFESKNKRYYKILDASHIKGYSKTTDFLLSKLPCLCVQTNTLIFTLLGLYDTDEPWYSVANPIGLAAAAESRAKSHLIDDKINESGNYTINQEEIDALYNMVEICDQNNYKPIFITTPYLTEYTDACEKVAPEAVKLFYKTVDELVKESGVNYYDFSHDERFSGRYDWFADSDHLNEAGSLVFTDILMQELVK